MNITPFLNVAKKDKVADISITGDIGYNSWADNEADYKKNTSEAMAAELDAIRALDVDVINVTLESLGGDVQHALAIYSMLKNSGAIVNTYYRGANASSSTIIGSAATSVDNIYMDNTGLFLVHKVMTFSEGNVNDMLATINDLNKWQTSLEQAYINIGVKTEVLTELMNRNGGHGEWLTMSECIEYGFVGKEWETNKILNYSKETFKNKNILIPNQFNNQKKYKMEKKETFLTEAQELGMFAKFRTWFKNLEEEQMPQVIPSIEEQPVMSEIDKLKADNEMLLEESAAHKIEMEAMRAEMELLKAELASLKPQEVEPEEVVEEVVAGIKKDDEDDKDYIKKKVKEEMKNLLLDIATPTKGKSNPAKTNLKAWELHLNNFQNFIK